MSEAKYELSYSQLFYIMLAIRITQNYILLNSFSFFQLIILNGG